ncbi:squalene synthase HpnC [Rhodoferax sp.]|uniref:squalene synthase HpnC n=2 Tax=Rhodoferax sp. TaxID=50421 RepID=UPI00262DF05C|nr:squalene synthase HpnC [Rhodoferax sp.]MDD4942521.1 squalene synthase HpnC [Rhodoferax sp.]MDD5479521.1 squalene synthase HpnC [Rhodoferax sp.]
MKNPVTHYENFPVASVLCPAHLRPAIAAIYHFARTADDLADEGTATPAERLAALAQFRQDLHAAAHQQPHSGRWPQVFEPLAAVIAQHALPVPLLADLLDAFEQDIRHTASQHRYAVDDELLDYCTRSANPVGRLLLHLYGVTDEVSLAQSDLVCTALQLINFWQDVGVDVARGRWYPSQQAMAQFGVTEADLQPNRHSENARFLIASYASSARSRMLKGSKLACRIPGRAGWELRLVVQGGLRILDKIEALDFATWRTRPKLNAWDMPVMLWRALWMRA